MCKNLGDEVGGVHLVNGSISSVAYSKVCILTIVEVHCMWGYYTTFTSAMVVGGCMKVSLILVPTATMMYVFVCTPVLV